MPRNRYQPTPEKRKQVNMLAGFGVSHEQICTLIGLRSPKTLRRYFSSELSFGIAESHTGVLQTAFKLATSRRNPAMTAFWLKTRARWSPAMTLNAEGAGDEQVVFIYEDYVPPAASAQP